MASDDDPIRAFAGQNEDGWTFEVYLHPGSPTGEIRFKHEGAEKFTQPIGIEEIAMFYAERFDLVTVFLDGVIKQHRPH
jgi:hypothetical protein